MPESTDALNPCANAIRQFFNEGMKQMDLVDHPHHAREIMPQYNELRGEESALH